MPDTLTISKGQLASLLGSIPETLSRILTRMDGMGLIQVDDRYIKLLDRDGLQKILLLKRIEAIIASYFEMIIEGKCITISGSVQTGRNFTGKQTNC